MDQGKVFERLLRLADARDLNVRLLPFRASEGRLKGNRIGIVRDLTIDRINYKLAHAYLHYDKGDTIHSERHADYEEQADRAAEMLLELASL